MELTYTKGHTSIVFNFQIDWGEYGDFVANRTKDSKKVISIIFNDDYNELEDILILDKSNVKDIIDFLTTKQEIRKPSPYVTRDDIISSYGLGPNFQHLRKEFSSTIYNKLYGSFGIEASSSLHLEKKSALKRKFPQGKILAIDVDHYDKYGFKETIYLDSIELAVLINQLKSTYLKM